MSRSYISLIPQDPGFVPNQEQIQNIANILTRSLLGGTTYEMYVSPNIQFHDPGEHLEEIRCSLCDASLSWEWWHEQMSSHYSNDHGFEKLDITTPCCLQQTTLNALKYFFDAGFAKFSIRIDDVTDIKEDIINEISRIIHVDVKVIVGRV